MFRPNVDQSETLDRTSYETAASFWNKSVPIYLINGYNQGTYRDLLAISLHNCVYRK